MNQALIAVALMGFVGAFGIGCGGNACDEAADTCAGDTPSEDSTEEAAEEVDCSGQTECAANCINDNETCDVTNEALATCIRDCAPN